MSDFVATENPRMAHVAIPSSKTVWAGRILSGLVIAFLILDGAMKIVKPAPVLESFVKLGYRTDISVMLGLVLLALALLYAIPRTAVLGALLLTGYLGGAVASHVRVGATPFEAIFPILFATLMWLGLWIRDERLRALLPLRGLR